MARLRHSKIIPFSRGEVFELLTDPHQLPLLFEDKVDVEVVDGAVELAKGSEYCLVMTRFRVSYRVRWKISEVVKGSRVTYEQVEGLLPKWEHTLFFEDTKKGETELVDRVDYQLPFGVLGLFVNDIFLRRDIRNLLCTRAEKACKILEEQGG